jgi:hypothetical protein
MKIHDLTIKAALLGAGLALLALPALADYHYASHTGTSTPPYNSWATAADSIQKAIDASSPHDTVYISAGDWYESIVTEMYDSVAIVGMGTDSTFCHYDSAHFAIFILDYGCSVSDISFFGYPNDVACIYANPYAGVVISKCEFHHSEYGIAATGYPVIITNCLFDSCWEAIDAGLTFLGDFHIANNLILNSYGSWAIFLHVNSALVENNIIINQPRPDLTALGGNAHYAITRNNVAMNGNNGIGIATSQFNDIAINFNRGPGGIGIAGSDSIINNSTSNCNNGIYAAGNQALVNYNNSHNNTQDIYGTPAETIGNIYRNPMYVSGNDFHLQMYSPLIDAGAPYYLDPDGSRSDIGAYGGPHGESYEYRDLPPKTPDSLNGRYSQDTIYLRWAYNTEADFASYYLFRDTLPGFNPSGINLLAEPESSSFIDTDVSNPRNYYYRISATDEQGNISGLSAELQVFTSGIWGDDNLPLPRLASIKTNYPNPFNSATTVVFWVANLGPQPAQIKITVYDITGRKVRTLVDDRMGVGQHYVIWDGKTDSGEGCPSGVYFAGISQWGLELSGQARRLLLVK